MKLAVFDFDSTLMDGETLEIIARKIGIDKEVKEINGPLMKSAEICRLCLELWKLSVN